MVNAIYGSGFWYLRGEMKRSAAADNAAQPRWRVLVTGAAGFVGAVLTRRLVADGHRVHVLLKPGTSSWRLADVERDLTLYEGDLTDEAATWEIVQAAHPDVIYHLAAHGGYSSQNDADAILRTNFLGTWNLLKACAGIDYHVFVNTGSSSEYGFKDHASRETDVLEPNSYYAVSKSAQTLLCQYVARAESRPITTFRLFSVYGPFEEPSRLVPTLIRRCLEGKDLTLTDPYTARDFVYVDDVVDAYLRLDELARLSGEILNIGTGLQTPLEQIVALLLQQTGARVACHWGSMPNRIWDTRTWVGDCDKSQRLLGWKAHTSLADGLARTIGWTRRRGSA